MECFVEGVGSAKPTWKLIDKYDVAITGSGHVIGNVSDDDLLSKYTRLRLCVKGSVSIHFVSGSGSSSGFSVLGGLVSNNNLMTNVSFDFEREGIPISLGSTTGSALQPGIILANFVNGSASVGICALSNSVRATLGTSSDAMQTNAHIEIYGLS